MTTKSINYSFKIKKICNFLSAEYIKELNICLVKEWSRKNLNSRYHLYKLKEVDSIISIVNILMKIEFYINKVRRKHLINVESILIEKTNIDLNKKELDLYFLMFFILLPFKDFVTNRTWLPFKNAPDLRLSNITYDLYKSIIRISTKNKFIKYYSKITNFKKKYISKINGIHAIITNKYKRLLKFLYYIIIEKVKSTEVLNLVDINSNYFKKYYITSEESKLPIISFDKDEPFLVKKKRISIEKLFKKEYSRWKNILLKKPLNNEYIKYESTFDYSYYGLWNDQSYKMSWVDIFELEEEDWEEFHEHSLLFITIGKEFSPFIDKKWATRKDKILTNREVYYESLLLDEFDIGVVKENLFGLNQITDFYYYNRPDRAIYWIHWIGPYHVSLFAGEDYHYQTKDRTTYNLVGEHAEVLYGIEREPYAVLSDGWGRFG